MTGKAQSEEAMPAVVMSPFPVPLASPARLVFEPAGTPLLTMSPVAPTPEAAEWQQHYLQLANLQNISGFLSPAGPPLAWPAAPQVVLRAAPPKQLDKEDETQPMEGGNSWGGASAGPLVDTVLAAKSLTEALLAQQSSVEGAADVLRTALSLLGRGDATAVAGESETREGEPSSGAEPALPAVKLVHPDEFKNPSTFLKIYGDPLCFAKNGPLPKKGRNGNWECAKCNNVNFPRRFRCNMCSTTRDEEGDRVVSEYARQVYERYIFIYKNQLGQNGVHQVVLDREGEHAFPPTASCSRRGRGRGNRADFQEGNTLPFWSRPF
eukprot:Protomagalhaensia_sp_Gyna_25__5447@NODE_713_length_2790_cov_347_884406_g555_i0_p1_GENE_NODE_713_length_2790_cov_347_884406_g555_i0NODE_713_length_2790_cov_347_884406_g555_i0_p1_ORF_typecomplete_len323_score38_34zfRanBP/PF00641_18/5_4e08zinc_ribbon_10/PF10058_9/0_28zinc_ribbon_10/PF10058_9/1_2e03DUF35_N/PF12172_8/1_3DUF35_N/PF12172_8/3_8e02_NODE_713_length_2790_cov_347_884406_g555_i011732141